MKQYIKILKCFMALVLAIITASAGICFAEEETQEIDTTYAVYLETALEAATEMVSNAIEEDVYTKEISDGWDFRNIDFASPLKAIIVFPTNEQYEQLYQFLQTDKTNLVKEIAKYVNIQWSKDYSDIAQQLSIHEDISSPRNDFDEALVLLFYGMHICLTFVESEGSDSVFIMSDASVLESADESYIPKLAQDLSVDGEINYIMYTAYDIAHIFGKNNNSTVGRFTRAIGATEETFLQMTPKALAGTVLSRNTNITVEAIALAYANSLKDSGINELEAIKKAKLLSEQVMAEIDASNAEEAGTQDSEKPDVQDAEEPDAQDAEEPDAQDSEEPEKWTFGGLSMGTKEYNDLQIQDITVPFPEDKTILIVSRSERDTSPQIGFYYESLLPVENIPDSEEEADLILLIDSKWEYQNTQNDIDVYACKTVLSLYDAASGEFQGIVGTSFNTLSGFVMVMGNTYYPNVNTSDVKAVIKSWMMGDLYGLD